MKKNYCLILFLLLQNVVVVAQKSELSPYPVHDFRIGIGLPPLRHMQNSGPGEKNITSIPNLYAFYSYGFSKRWKASMTFAYYNDNESRTSTDAPISSPNGFWADGGSGRFSHYRLTPAVQFEWFRKGIVTLYSDLGCTFDITHKFDEFNGRIYQNDVHLYIRPNITPIGITLGRQLYFSAELFSFGPRGLFNVGIGYRM